MGLENIDNDSCFVCKHFLVANRQMVRDSVTRMSVRSGRYHVLVRKDLCKKCYQIGFSARSHTVGEAGIPLDATEEGDSSHIPLLPTFIKADTHIHPDHEDASVRRHWKYMITQFFKKK